SCRRVKRVGLYPGAALLHHRVVAMAALGAALASWPRPAAAEVCPPAVMVTAREGTWRPLLTPVIHHWTPVQAIPCGNTVLTRTRPRLTICGAVLLVATHAPALVVGAIAARSDAPSMVAAIPIAGPLVAISREPPFARVLVGFLAMIDSLGQAGGLG